jgi:hypothetical protein
MSEEEHMKKVETFIEENILKHVDDVEKRERLRKALDIRNNKPEQENDMDKLLRILFGSMRIGLMSMVELDMEISEEDGD